MNGDYEKILVAVDGSENANTAFEKAIPIIKRNNAELFIAHIIERPNISRTNQFTSAFTSSLKAEGQKIVDKYQEKAKEEGIEGSSTILEVGSAKQVLARELPKNENIDLIIIGATGTNAVSRYFIGSVAENVTRHAACDVLVVHMEDEDKENT